MRGYSIRSSIGRHSRNVLILPKEVTLQDNLAADLHGETLPEEPVTRLALSNLEGVDNLSPKLCVPAR